jgi:hypothetical protein
MILIQRVEGGLLYSLTANDHFIIRTIKQHTGGEKEKESIYMYAARCLSLELCCAVAAVDDKYIPHQECFCYRFYSTPPV